jgi:hypothetical protein
MIEGNSISARWSSCLSCSYDTYILQVSSPILLKQTHDAASLWMQIKHVCSQKQWFKSTNQNIISHHYMVQYYNWGTGFPSVAISWR